MCCVLNCFSTSEIFPALFQSNAPKGHLGSNVLYWDTYFRRLARFRENICVSNIHSWYPFSQYLPMYMALVSYININICHHILIHHIHLKWITRNISALACKVIWEYHLQKILYKNRQSYWRLSLQHLTHVLLNSLINDIVFFAFMSHAFWMWQGAWHSTKSLTLKWLPPICFVKMKLCKSIYT